MREAGIPVDLKKVDLKAKQYDGGDYKQVNGKGYVPAVETPAGVLTEAPGDPAVHRRPEAGMPASRPSRATRRATSCRRCSTSSPPNCTRAWATFFNPAMNDGWRQAVTERLGLRFDWLAKQLEGKQYLMGDKFSVADAYLFTILNWAPMAKFDLSKWPAITDYHKRVAARPKVQEALKAEGLVK